MWKWMTGAGLILITLVWLFSRDTALTVQTATVTVQPLTVTVQEQGRTRAHQPFIVTAPVQGQLLRTQWREGDQVTAGQLLAELAIAADDSRLAAGYQADLAAAIARRHAAEATLTDVSAAAERATREAQRRERLFLDRMIGEEERDQFRQARESAQARLLSAEAAVQAAVADEARARAALMGSAEGRSDNGMAIIAPVSGTIQAVFERGDTFVTPGTPLFQISDGDSLELVIDVLTQDAVQIAPGATIHLTGWGGTQTLRGRVRYVEPQAFTKYSALGVEEQRVNVIGELTEQAPALGAGYRFEAAIEVWHADDVLTAPTSALFRQAGEWQVFVINEERAERRTVDIGRRNREYAEVLSGLSANDRVILFPSDQISEGTRVSD